MKLFTFIRHSIAGVAFAGLLATGAWAQSSDSSATVADRHHDRQDLRQDRRDRNADNRDIRRDNRDIRHSLHWRAR